MVVKMSIEFQILNHSKKNNSKPMSSVTDVAHLEQLRGPLNLQKKYTNEFNL